jgi:phospholipid/cholesterol/gamma-HCH transport system substrate-binding protein
VGIYFFLTNFLGINNYTVKAVYSDAQGLTEGSNVTLAGVTIGAVDKVTLDKHQHAVIVMKISKKYKIPEGSRFFLHVGLLVGEKQIDIVPNRSATKFIKPGAEVQGVLPPSLEDLIPQGQKLMANLTHASEKLDNLLSGTELRSRLDRTFANMEDASAKLKETMGLIQNMLPGQTDNVKTITSNLAAASGDVRTVTHDLARFAEEGKVQSQMTDILAKAKQTVESLDRTASSLEKLATNPQLQSDIKESVAGVKQTVDAANKAMTRIDKILGVDHGKASKFPTLHGSVQGLYRPEHSRLRVDARATLDFGNARTLDLGIYDLGVDNKAIFEPGFSIGPRADFRYGVYASRLGVGLDYDFSDRLFGTADIYNTVSPRLDVITGYRVGPDLDMLLGVDKLFKDNQVTAGVRLSR